MSVLFIANRVQFYRDPAACGSAENQILLLSTIDLKVIQSLWEHSYSIL